MEIMDIREYRKTILNVLFQIDDICRAHHLTYILYVGTLLGAVRHKGFIPWDDDIDIAMPRDDYEKLADILRREDHGLKFLRYDENPDVIWPYAKVCDPNTKLEESNFPPVKDYGAFVDVFPYDNACDSKWKRAYFAKRHAFMLRVIQHSAKTGHDRACPSFRNFLRMAADRIAKHCNTLKWIKRLDEGARYGGTPESLYFWVQGNIDVPKAAVLPTRDIEFEGRMLMGPADPDAILKRKFGDYMTLPPPEKRVPKHSLICFKKS